jgi:hypothetical protein
MGRSLSVVGAAPRPRGSRAWLAASAMLFLGSASVAYAADLRVMKTGLGNTCPFKKGLVPSEAAPSACAP